MIVPVEYYVALSMILFTIGIFGVLTRKNLIAILLSVELMLNAANINFIAFSQLHDAVSGNVFALFSIGIAAAEVAVGLAILLAASRTVKTLAMNMYDTLRG